MARRPCHTAHRPPQLWVLLSCQHSCCCKYSLLLCPARLSPAGTACEFNVELPWSEAFSSKHSSTLSMPGLGRGWFDSKICSSYLWHILFAVKVCTPTVTVHSEMGLTNRTSPAHQQMTSPLPIPCTRQPPAHNICFSLCINVALLKGLKASFQGYFLTTSLLQLPGQWVFQTMNCSESTENIFPSTQVKRAEQSSANEAHVALRKHTNYN